MSGNTIGKFRIKVKGRKFSHKYVLTLEHIPSGRVLWKDKTMFGDSADFKYLTLRKVCLLLKQRPLSVQASVATNELKSLVDECWREVCAQD